MKMTGDTSGGESKEDLNHTKAKKVVEEEDGKERRNLSSLDIYDWMR